MLPDCGMVTLNLPVPIRVLEKGVPCVVVEVVSGEEMTFMVVAFRMRRMVPARNW